jgi:hypothetical protein
MRLWKLDLKVFEVWGRTHHGKSKDLESATKDNKENARKNFISMKLSVSSPCS